jgi:hypothetical protein
MGCNFYSQAKGHCTEVGQERIAIALTPANDNMLFFEKVA